MQRESNRCDKYWFPSNVHVSKGFNYCCLEIITTYEEEIESDREGSGVHNKLFDNVHIPSASTSLIIS